ncbi:MULTISPECIES: quinone oxidoreductase family protein [Rhodobacterales]|jgi:NADPH2:quinone reductase|uniref:Quinone oxidoreductase 1 n=2 Tax=Rhodobacterales TaxID=204455 RepID=A0A238LKJ1_9RHOB|nr:MULTISPECIES: quinone oxidoreductase [Rhodobacterales]KZY50381.1 quinone oxidoreductase [Sulfitobacter sp. HI0054]SMY10209.1 Quinone oxidoreductase 1 [Flavimaricola marinus]
MKAIKFHKTGGPEVMQYEDITLDAPGPGEVRLRHTAIGVNYLDTYYRSGAYPLPLPSGLGSEAAGVVEAVGEGVTTLKVGDRVAYGAGPIGSYSQARNMPANRLSKLPDTISDETAAAMMLKGMTVRYLLRETYKVKAGETILWHAVAGGVGLIAVQWAKHLGVRVIGTTSSPEKAALAKSMGCDEVINYTSENVAERVRELTDGKGVPVVYDGVGQATLNASLDSLSPFGLLVNFGSASGPVTGFDTGILAAKGSLYLTRPGLNTYVDSDEALQANVADLFDVVGSGAVRIEVNQTYPLADAVKAHQDLEGRKTTGSTILLP